MTTVGEVEVFFVTSDLKHLLFCLLGVRKTKVQIRNRFSLKNSLLEGYPKSDPGGVLQLSRLRRLLPILITVF